MDFTDDQPLWGTGSDDDGEDEYLPFGAGMRNMNQSPVVLALPSCHPSFQPPPARPFHPASPAFQRPAPSFPRSQNTTELPTGRHQRAYLSDRPDAPEYNSRSREMSFASANTLQRAKPGVKAQKSEDFGDEIWDDDDFVQAANQSLQYEADAVYDDDEPVATADVVKNRESMKKNVAPNKRGKSLVPISRLPMDERKLFKFPAFNDVQSYVFDDTYSSDENLVVSAPTGSGKTTIFELAFLHCLSYKTPDDSIKPLAIYIAPTKALCNEKAKDWQERMGVALPDVICVEITGDYGNASTIYNSIRGADLIVTTPEKFDSMTRRSRNMENMAHRLRLIMIDEVHILRESRGATLEVVISRMKGLGKGIRFVALSATVPNIDDIARWLGPARYEYGQLSRGVIIGKDLDKKKTQGETNVDDMPMAKVYKFGEEFRPVPLSRETYGIDSGGNDWALASRMDKELFPILLKHAAGQPVLVFCPTRKSCQATADLIFSMYEESRAKGLKLPWQHPPGVRLDLQDKRISELSTCGIAVHHAGLDYGDRRAIEDGFRDGKLHMIASTSTLAVGVNLPAHTVVIKGVMAWQGPATGFKEYSDIDIQQMMGRAGRPQYDKSGVVVVMCERSKVRKYETMLRSQTVLESCLHENLTEYINSEIGLGTITSVYSAQEWYSSFFHIRIQQNPRYYALSNAKDKPAHDSWEEWLDHYVEEALLNLERDGFIERSEDDGLTPTETGKIMSGSMISYGTMCSIKEMSPMSTLQDLLEILAGATEFADLRIRQGESSFLNKLRDNQEIRFPLGEKVQNYADKVFLMLQVTFGNIILDDIVKKTEISPPIQTLMAIYNHAPRIAKAIVQFALNREYGTAARSALELHRTLSGKAWEDSPTIFRQIPSIGPKSICVLGQNGISTFEELLDVGTEKIQLWLNRNSEFARGIHDQARRMPRFHVSIEEEGMNYDGASNVLNLRINIRPKSKVLSTESKGKRGGFITLYNLSTLFLRQDGSFIGYRRMELRKLDNKDTSFVLPVTLDRRCEKVVAVVAAVDEVAGCCTMEEYETHLDSSVYPEDMEEQDEALAQNPSQRTLVEPDPEPEERLPNGNVPCHHNCKDKQSCQHNCCKVGVPSRKKDKAAAKGAGNGNVKTETDRMKETQKTIDALQGDSRPTAVAKAVQRVQQERSMSRSPSPIASSQKASQTAQPTPRNRTQSISGLGKPKNASNAPNKQALKPSTAISRVRESRIVRRSESVDEQGSRVKSTAPLDSEIEDTLESKVNHARHHQEPLFMAHSEDETPDTYNLDDLAPSDEETEPVKSRFFDKSKSGKSSKSKKRTAPPARDRGSHLLASQQNSQVSLEDPPRSQRPAQPIASKKRKHDEDTCELMPTRGIFSDGYETLTDSPDFGPKPHKKSSVHTQPTAKSQAEAPLTLSSSPHPVQDFNVDDLLQEYEEEEEEPHHMTRKQSPFRQSRTDGDWDLDMRKMSIELNSRPCTPLTMGDDSKDGGIPRDEMPVSRPTAIAQPVRRLAPLNIGGFGRPAAKRLRMMELSNQHKTQPNLYDEVSMETVDTDRRGSAMRNGNVVDQRAVLGLEVDVPVDENDEFEKWCTGGI
ncbi:ATP-dependent DNA helicase HFM1/MER3 [Cryptococcus wingfieldii CBS 7118]|uniref:DNA 3'-5' helicase n=1 Tax=Cryptococcus wingfieldii CBS 7118 TaxID=1295528 RepID=A0A1E3K5X0_9TREE|nr:ATP-dependent DNA helicase HFM1/MER3 [Cryptococcus wingfieldii CBS 7118]ODO08415.1 ATP-dependent DNA helicase HFM1/MER3 [Cryptococcus wingfieldii CBS 7118]